MQRKGQNKKKVLIEITTNYENKYRPNCAAVCILNNSEDVQLYFHIIFKLCFSLSPPMMTTRTIHCCVVRQK